jgi:hypothetical protein
MIVGVHIVLTKNYVLIFKIVYLVITKHLPLSIKVIIGLLKIQKNPLKYLKALLKNLYLIATNVKMNLKVNYAILQMVLGVQIVDIKQKIN